MAVARPIALQHLQEYADISGRSAKRWTPFPRSAVPAAPRGARPTPAADDQPYGGEITLVAVIGTLFVPLISLIIALVVRSGERRESRRQFLKTWAIACAAWMCTG